MQRAGGIVLCGGHSKRMGRDKAWLPFGSELMLPRVVRLLSEAVQPVVVVAAAGQDLPQIPVDVLVLRDKQPGRGPLQGLAAGLAALTHLVDAAYASSCDAPFLQPALVRRLLDLLGDHDICMPESNGYRHPLAAVYRPSVLERVEQLLRQDRLSLVGLSDLVQTRLVQTADLLDVDPYLESLRNINTPKDYQAAVLVASSREQK